MQWMQSFCQQLPQLCRPVTPAGLTHPHWVLWSNDCAAMLEMGPPDKDWLAVFSGNVRLPEAHYYAQAYAGHQFGGYTPTLGDGRAILLGELTDHQARPWDVALKGAGRTPFSRHGDGRAVLRSTIREFLGSEALHHLGIPTTRALAVIGSDTPVQRETLESGAICVRLARSHIRFGHFEYLTHTARDLTGLTQLVDFTIARYFPQHQGNYAGWFAHVVQLTARMIAHWQAAGFIHGVLNTDNMSILGDTLDFGPFAFMDSYRPAAVANLSDHEGRYRFEHQPGIGLWNLQRLADALAPLIPEADLQDGLAGYQAALEQHYLMLMRQRLGLLPLVTSGDSSAADAKDMVLIGALLQHLARFGLDYHLSLRGCCQVRGADLSALEQVLAPTPEQRTPELQHWLGMYRQRLSGITDIAQWQRDRKRANPIYLLRNYLAQQAISAAEQGDMTPVQQLYQLLRHPFDEQPQMAQYARRPPAWGEELYCSCSS
ncbi:UPF0061 protein [Shewanella sp. NFH-SH190041]|uniref:protein adenylyltransferase SelO n=1 Tax=Shewanella sp. NFH-SH190041 TaxID=2950245 RepID=UPI0021C26420|nr:YdiU family protein [Shewanella sp. NFH-SH190041]BDM66009.1 UPF0061 protein [Shewanella sp. NFH-SH190041]